MANRNVAVPVTGEFRDPNSFVYLDNNWNAFLEHWNHPKTTLNEALGLLHGIIETFAGCEEYFKNRAEEDVRETCVRFLMHYAGTWVRYDAEGQIQRKAYKVLTQKFIGTHHASYLSKPASLNLLLDVLDFYFEFLPDSNPDERSLEKFLQKAYKIEVLSQNPFIKAKLDNLANALFRSRFAGKELAS